MTNWIELGRALEIPSGDLDRVASVLESLETAFQPLVKQIPASAEPAVLFSVE